MNRRVLVKQNVCGCLCSQKMSLAQQLTKVFGKCTNQFFACGNHPMFPYTDMMRKYDEDLYLFFMNVKHEAMYQDTLCWYREGVMYSGIKFVLSSCSWAAHSAAVCPRKVYSFNVWCYHNDTIQTKYLKLYRDGSHVSHFYFYDHLFTENNPVLGSEASDARFECAFHKAVCDSRLDVTDAIQDILYHTHVLVSPYFLQLARFVRDNDEWDYGLQQ